MKPVPRLMKMIYERLCSRATGCASCTYYIDIWALQKSVLAPILVSILVLCVSFCVILSHSCDCAVRLVLWVSKYRDIVPCGIGTALLVDSVALGTSDRLYTSTVTCLFGWQKYTNCVGPCDLPWEFVDYIIISCLSPRIPILLYIETAIAFLIRKLLH